VGRIGIFGPEDDDQALHVAACARRLGADVVFLRPAEFPWEASLSDADGRLHLGQDDLSDVAGWYIRTYNFVATGDAVADRERQGFLGALIWNAGSRARVVNPVPALMQNALKLRQLHLFREAGLPLPRTLVSNDPDRVKAFVAEQGDVVYKPVAGGALARRWEPGDEGRLGALREGPVIFQECVTGTNLRIHVLDGDVISAGAIASDALDYREADFDIAPHPLTVPERKLCRTAAAAVGMPFAALDMIRRPDGSLVLLEANPTGYFLLFEQRLSHPIGSQLASYLVSGGT
jgi:glutathione synthase/RimK-type ligase-like ATP-grasp enzyme